MKHELQPDSPRSAKACRALFTLSERKRRVLAAPGLWGVFGLHGIFSVLGALLALLSLLSLFSQPAQAQTAPTQSPTASSQIYRCGNEYLNDAAIARARGCKPMLGGHLTIVPATALSARLPGSEGPPAQAGNRTRMAQQHAVGGDPRAILLAELQAAETRLAEQRKEYNNGEPEKLGPETRNHQRYLDRVNDLREGLLRFESDIAGLKRELARLP